MHRASRYRLYPNRTQERQFARLCGAGRFVYNELLADQIREYGRFKAGEIERPGASEFDFGKRYTRLKAKEGNCLACGYADNADANAARNILNLGLEKLWAGGAPVTGRGGDNEAGAFFMECLVETANDPSTMSWNYRGSAPDFHTKQ